jgi:uncharacterized protein YndB with AHSA1/START domain
MSGRSDKDQKQFMPVGTLNTFRAISAGAEEIFAAFSDSDRLARWWGPAGFTNTFHTFEFKIGGRWIYTMHGPNGKDYPNECVFRVIEPSKKIVIEHVVLPLYTLTVTFKELEGITTVTWDQHFENQVFATKMNGFLQTANEQNLERLAGEVES